MLASLTQTAGSLKAAASLTINGALDNQAGTLNAAALTAKSTVKNAADLTVTGLLTATAATTNSGTLSAGQFQVGDVTNADGGILNATAADMKSVFGVTNNSGDLSVAGESTFGAVTNAKNLTLAKDAVLASLTQTAAAGKTASTAGLNVTGALDNQAGSITAGTLTAGSTVKNADAMTVTGTFTAADTVTNAKSITAGTFNFQDFVNNANAVLKSTDADSVTGSSFGTTDNKGEINLAGIANFGAVTNAGTIALAGAGTMASLKQIAGTTTAKDALTLQEDSQVGGILAVSNKLTTAGLLVNTGTLTAGSADTFRLMNHSDMNVTGLLHATSNTWNNKNITAGVLNLAGVTTKIDSLTKSTDAAQKSTFGATTNAGTIDLAGASAFGAVTNTGTLKLAKDATLASLNQTAGNVTAGNAAVTIAGLLDNAAAVTAKSLSFNNAASKNDAGGVITATAGVTTGSDFMNAGTINAGTAFNVQAGVSTLKGTVTANALNVAAGATVKNLSATNKFKTLAAKAGSFIENNVSMALDTIAEGANVTYNQTGGTLTTADNSFFNNSILNISGGTLDRTGDTSRAAGANTLGEGNTVNISGATAGSFTDQTQVGSNWKAGQTLVTVGLLDSKSTINLKSGGILEAGSIALTDKSLHMDGGALSASLGNFFTNVSEKVYKINDGTETTLNSTVLGAANVSGVKDSLKNNMDFTNNGGTLVVTDKAVSLRAIASASAQLKAMAGARAEKVNVVFTGTAAGSSGTLTGFYHNTYQELAAEQGQGSSFKNPGVVFATMAYENRAEDGGATRDKLVVGTTTEAADTFVLGDSIGFARVEGTDNVTVNSGKTLALIGGAAGTNLLDSAAGTLTVTGADSKFVMGTKGVAGTEGALGTLNVTESGAMTVAMGKYAVTNLNLKSGTGSTGVGTTLLVANLADNAASTFENQGTLSITTADKLNSAFTNSGDFNVASNTVLANTFTNNAGRAVFDGTVEMQKAVTNAKDAVIKTAGFTVSSALTGTHDNVINNAGRLESTGANTVAGSMIVAKDGALVATDVTNITTGRINVLGDSRFKEVNVGVNGRGALGAAADALIHADTITVGTLGQVRLRDGATVVAKNLKVDGMMSAGNVSWALGAAAVNGWNKKNADRYATLMGEYATPTAMLSSLSSRAVFGIATYGADTVNSSVDHTVVASPAADAVILKAGDGEKYWIDVDRTADFSMPITVGGTVGTSGNNFSANTDVNYTYTFDTAVVKADADATFMDISYILEGKTLTVNDGGTIFIEDTEDTDYQPGVMVVRGNLVNNGDIMSTDGTGLVVAGSGVVTIGSTGTDMGKTLVVTGDGTYKVDGGEADYAGLELKSGTLNIAKGWFGYGLAKADAGYTGDKPAVFATNLDTIETNDARLIVGTVAANDTVAAGSVYFGEDSALVLDTSNLVDKTIFKGNNSGTFTVKVGSELAVSHTTWGKHYILGDGYDLSGFTDDAWNGDYIKNLTGDDIELAVSKTEDGKLMLSAGAGEDPDPNPDPAPDPAPDPDPDPNPNPQPDTSIKALSPDFAVPDVIDGLINDEANIGLRDPNSNKMDVAFIERVLDKDYVGKTSTGALDVTKATQVWNSAVQLSAASGMNAYALSSVTDTMGAMEVHASDSVMTKGKTLWVKASGKYGKTDKLESDGAMKGGYEATSGGFIFGADVANSGALTLGAAFSYTKGDLESQGNFTKTDTDAEIFGGNLYGAYRIGDAAIIGHAGYGYATGEAKQNYQDVKGNAYAIKGDVDSEFLTLGLRGEMSFALTKGLIVMPHAGLRYVHSKAKGYDITINGKDAWQVDSETSDIVQVPVGVALKGSLRAKNWWVSPYADVSLVQSFGDTDSTATVHATGYKASDSYSYDVTGKTAGELKLGITASKKHHNLGISYTGGVGDKGSQTHSVTASYSYSF